MRKPRNRSDAERLPTGLVTFPANGALGALSTTTLAATGVVGVKYGKCVVVVSCEAAGGPSPECQCTGHCPADGVVLLQLTHAGSGALNFPQTVYRYIVIPM